MMLLLFHALVIFVLPADGICSNDPGVEGSSLEHSQIVSSEEVDSDGPEQNKEPATARKSLVSGVLYPDDYNKNVPPPGKSVVRIGFDIQDVSEVDDKDFSITLILLTIMQWNDSRIHVHDRVSPEIEMRSIYVMSPHEYGGMWVPNQNYLNLKLQSPIKDGEANERYVIVGEEDMRFFRDELTRTTVSCPMDFTSFPFDKHICYVEIINIYLPLGMFEFVYFEVNGTAQWGRAATSTILPYTVEFSDIEEERKTRPYVYFTGFGGAYSHAGFKIKLNRKPTPYILNYYLPSALFVMVSWTSFVIPADAIPGRVALLVTTFLSLANIINSAFAISPINQGINQMQIWIICCIGFVFLAIMEFFFLLWFTRFSLQMNLKKSFPKPQCWLAFPVTPSVPTSPQKVDRLFLYLSPLLFGLYSAAYWGYALFL